MPPSSPPTIEISDTQALLPVQKPALAALVRRVCLAQGLHGGSISVAIVDDPTIHRLNREHLGHDWPTDVITFDLREPGESELSGALVVSAETALRVARDVGVEPTTELALYVIHGLLHLSGLDDQDDEARACTCVGEAELMALLGLDHPGASPVDEEGGPTPSTEREATPWAG